VAVGGLPFTLGDEFVEEPGLAKRVELRPLDAAGHDLEIVGAYDGIMGHAGAVVVCPDGLIEGASDPRCDGAAAAL